MPDAPSCLLRARDRASRPEESGKHPLNPRSEVHGHRLSDAVGMKRIGLHLLRIPPGKESFILHNHRHEEEFMFVLSGRGIAQIGSEEHEVRPGDFLGFAAPSVAHHLKNPFEEDLIYLSGGERTDFEVADFPTEGKRLVRIGEELMVFPIAAAEPMKY